MEDLVRPSAEFWSGKRVLLTGHTGFKGAWLSLWLQHLGAEVFGLALPPLKDSLFSAAKLDAIVAGTYGDIRNLDVVTSTFRSFSPDIVLHLAAQPLVRASYQLPVETYATNVMGTVHVLAGASQQESLKACLIVTSDKCYENREWHWSYRENEPMGGSDPYSSSKGCAELVTAAWRKSYCHTTALRSFGLASARAGNVIGGGDWSDDRLVPDCIRAMEKSETISIRHPGALRPWQHVLDALCGYLVLAERLWTDPVPYGDAWNFGPWEEDVKPVSWVVSRVTELWGNGASWSVVGNQGPHEASLLKVDSSKARSKLLWSPILRVDDAVYWTVDWYRRFMQGESALELTREQICQYIEQTDTRLIEERSGKAQA